MKSHPLIMFLAPLFLQLVLAFAGSFIGVYVGLAVENNNIQWIEKVLDNHESRIQALEDSSREKKGQ